MKMKRFVAALAIFSLSGIGITYAAGTDSNPVQNFFLGGTDLGSPNLNQVLALLVGPEGPPGPAGVAGAFSGLSAITASVVINRAAIDAAFCNAERVTLAGSIIPDLIMSTYSPVAALRPCPAGR